MRLGTFYRYLLIQALNLPMKGTNVLDIGGYDGFIVSKINSFKKTLVDLDVNGNYSDINYIKGDFLSHDFNDNKFDLIYALDVLEHVKNDDQFLTKIIQLLPSKGIAILSVPSEEIRIFPYIIQSIIDKKWGHIYRRGYRCDQILKITEDFQNIKTEITYWNCPIFRFLYLPLKMAWLISPNMTKEILRHIVSMDSKYRNGDNGFLIVTIKKT